MRNENKPARRAVQEETASKDVDTLRAAADKSAKHVRTVYVFLLLFGFYIAVIVFSTTDEQLLKESPVTLPLLDVQLPLVGFYAVIPWLFVLLHANFLTQLYLLSCKLAHLGRAMADLPDVRQRFQRDLLFPFLLSHVLIGRHHPWGMRAVFAVAAWITTALFPLLLLLSLQIRFVPYHDYAVTVSHQAAVIVQVGLLWAAWAGARGWTSPVRLWRALWAAPTRLRLSRRQQTAGAANRRRGSLSRVGFLKEGAVWLGVSPFVWFRRRWVGLIAAAAGPC